MEQHYRSRQINENCWLGLEYINPYHDENFDPNLYQFGGDTIISIYDHGKYGGNTIDVNDPTKDNVAILQKALGGLGAQYMQTLQAVAKQSGRGQIGTGVIDDIGAAVKLIRSATKLNSKSGVSRSKKDVENPHPNYRPGFAGERHLQHRSGSIYNFLGPGTRIRERVSRGDNPLDGANGIDAQARRHDLDYLNARDLKDIRAADLRMIKGVQKSNAPAVEKVMVSNAMKAKIKAENLGILDPNKYAGFQNNADVKTQGKGMYPDSDIRKKLEKKYGNKR